MLGERIKHPESTNFHDVQDGDDRTAKRLKTEVRVPVSQRAPRRDAKTVIADSEDELEDVDEEADAWLKGTGLETALPQVNTDQEAIDEYETSRASQVADGGTDAISGRLEGRKWARGKSSIYVDAFNLALETVLDEELHLFDGAEKALFEYWRGLSYEAQYLYVRLFLRKLSAWHRINSLTYHNDIGNLESCIAELQQCRILPKNSMPSKIHPGELEPPPGTCLEDSFIFAESSDLIETLEEASTLLKLDELKVIAKDARIQGKTKKELVEGLRRTSRQQTGLKAILRRSVSQNSAKSAGSPPSVKDDSDSTHDDTSTDFPDDPDRNRNAHFLKKILDETGPCIRLSLAPLKLFERVHLVFYRSTEWTEKSLTTIILARIARRNFPEYIVSRSASVFETRALLVEFETSLRTQFRVDNILEFAGKPTSDAFQTIIQIYEEVYPRWKALLAEEQRKENHVYQSGEGAYLRRLSPAWVYTRIIHKAAYVFGKRKDYKMEYELLVELLSQKLFHHSRRGSWFQRKALLEEHYMPALGDSEGRNDESQKRHWKRIALATCEDGLQDPLVHIMYHHDLQKRITRLERACKIPKREQHNFSHVRLATPVEVYVEGCRIEREVDDSRFGQRDSSSAQSGLRGTKTIWLDPLEGNGECSVEAMCLSHYRSQGWKGYHSEGGIVRTLFAYLFYDILFTYVPNVFQTQFQTCPLDLHTDAFYPSRVSEINHRLAEIGNGAAGRLIKQVFDDHSERKTCVVGLDWNFDLEDLLEIAELFNGEALATVCKVMAQEYGTRGGGIPDLFLWHTEEKQVKFAEVKSENDRLSDTQRLWIHVLTGAGVRVELCNAVAKQVKRSVS